MNTPVNTGALLIMTTFTEEQEKFANDIMLAIKAHSEPA